MTQSLDRCHARLSQERLCSPFKRLQIANRLSNIKIRMTISNCIVNVAVTRVSVATPARGPCSNLKHHDLAANPSESSANPVLNQRSGLAGSGCVGQSMGRCCAHIRRPGLCSLLQQEGKDKLSPSSNTEAATVSDQVDRQRTRRQSAIWP
jgi:hypothetical protein